MQTHAAPFQQQQLAAAVSAAMLSVVPGRSTDHDDSLLVPHSNSPIANACGAVLLDLADEDFIAAWARMPDEARTIQLAPWERQTCIDRYRKLTPHVAHTIERLARLAPVGASAPVSHFQVLTALEVMHAPPLQWLVRGVLPARGLACLFGASGSGKSFLALDLCAAIAAGADWFTCRVTAAPVVYVALEGEGGFSQRVSAWCKHHAHDMPDTLRFVMQPFDLRHAGDIAAIIEAVRHSGCAGGVLVIDTLNRAASGADENASRDMGELIDACKRLQAELGGLVLLVHHNGKDTTKGMRGHSSLHAALDAAIQVARDGDQRAWSVAKAKDGHDGISRAFRLRVVNVGEHADGETATSCVVVPDDGKPARKAKRPSGANQKIVYEALSALLRKGEHFAQGSAPAGRPCVQLENALPTCADKLTSEPKRRNTLARRAITDMVANGILCNGDGWLWLP